MPSTTGVSIRLLVKSRQPAELKGAVIAALDRYLGQKDERLRIALPVHFSHSASGENLQLAHPVDISNSGAGLVISRMGGGKVEWSWYRP